MGNNSNMKKIGLFALAIFLGNVVFSQQDAMYSHYAFNTLAVNPGYAGSREVITITGLHRSQWVGFEGAPITQTVTFHSPVITEELGIGLSFVNDKIGPIKMTSFYLDLSYRFKLNRYTKFAIGLKGGGSLFQGDLAKLNTTQNNDGVFTNINSTFLPNVGIGLYLSNKKWYAGLSVPRLLENDFIANATSSLNRERRHYFIIAGFITKLNRRIKLKPTTYIKATANAPIEADLTAMFIFNDVLELGLMGRTGDAVGVLFGYNFSTQFRVGYSFDWSFTNETGVYNLGSHELIIRYDIINLEHGKIHSPRYF